MKEIMTKKMSYLKENFHTEYSLNVNKADFF